MGKTFVGLGFGPIQSGLFLLEAHLSGNFERLVVCEVVDELVQVLQRQQAYVINVAERERVRFQIVEGVEFYNPLQECDQPKLTEAIASAHEIATALPSVQFYDRGNPSPVDLLTAGLIKTLQNPQPVPKVIYAAENDFYAASMLREKVKAQLDPALRDRLDQHVQFVNTVIGKMSGKIELASDENNASLQPLYAGGGFGVLVEEFNRILIDKIRLPGFERGLAVFEEKSDLLPFEEAKLFGHNAAHSLMGYLADRQGMKYMSEATQPKLLEIVEAAFLQESGAALCARHQGVDPLFTTNGWQDYARDLIQRMVNPHLQDQVERVIRDPRRKLGWNDRLVGTMRVALEYGIQSKCYAIGAAAALLKLAEETALPLQQLMEHELWQDVADNDPVRARLISLIEYGLTQLESFRSA